MQLVAERADSTWHGPVVALRVLLGIVGVVALAPVVLSLLLRHVTVDHPNAAAYVSGTPLVIFAGIAGVVLFALAWSRLGVAVAAVLTVLLALTQVPLYIGTAAAAPGSSPLVVMTLNMHFGGADAAEVVATVRERGVDVLAIEELTPNAVADLRANGLEDVLPHHELKPHTGASGNGLWSRLPLEHAQVPDGFGHPPVAATLELDGTALLVAAVHPVSPYPEDAATWSREMGDLATWLDGLAAPAVVAGDFNATRDHQQFRAILATGFEDAATQVGAGWQPTFPANRVRVPMLITIDHVLVNDGIVATRVETVEIPNTDHAAVIATLAVPPGLGAADE